jgi:hypothetical protein
MYSMAIPHYCDDDDSAFAARFRPKKASWPKMINACSKRHAVAAFVCSMVVGLCQQSNHARHPNVLEIVVLIGTRPTTFAVVS